METLVLDISKALKLYNHKEKILIYLLGDIVPKFYMEPPHYEIILHGYEFQRHIHTCKCCQAFVNDFGKESKDWFLEYDDKKFIIDMRTLGKEYEKNHFNFKNSIWFLGAQIKLNIYPEQITDYMKLLEEQCEVENYENCLEIKNIIEILQQPFVDE